MPVMGPDLHAAREDGREVGRKILAEMIAKGELFDITDARYNGMFASGKSRERWAAAKEAFIEATGELFAQDAINSF